MTVDNWLTFDDSNKWVIVIKQEDLNYYTDTFEPWQTKQKLKLGVEVEWSVGWKYYWNIITDTTVNWNIAVTWVWFTPKLIKFTAGYSDDTLSWFSVWHYVNWRNDSLTSYENAVDYSSNSRCFRLWWTNWLWKVASVNSDWFVLSVKNPWWITYTVMYECFW